MSQDPALDTLFLPFDEGRLAMPPGAAFLGARDGAALQRWRGAGLVLQQDFKPTADALERARHADVVAELDPAARYPAVLVLPPRQREHARAVLGRAVLATAPDGHVVAAAANNAGARSLQDDLAALLGGVTAESKHKCRVAWGGVAAADMARAAEWAALDAARTILDGTVHSRPGLFAWDRIDPASGLLADALPAGLVGRGADLGAGWGYLSRVLLARSPGLASLDAYEAQFRALPVLAGNLAAVAGGTQVRTHWHDVTAGIDGAFDVIVSNPPFHADDRTDRPELGRRFIEVAAKALRPGGRLFMVANRHLPYEATLAACFASVRLVVQAGGFKVFEAIR